MPDQSMVEELLEKGARAEFNDRALDSNWDEIAEWQKFKLRKAFAAGLDAVFPGWREYAPLLAAVATGEGITREWATELPGYGSWEHRSDEAAAREQATNGHMRLLARWVGPWVPVEEGTDG